MIDFTSCTEYADKHKERERIMEFTLYRNDNIKLDFSMSKLLRNLINEADELYEKDDWFWYDMKVREIESSSKQDLLSGFINEAEFRQIWERYGIS